MLIRYYVQLPYKYWAPSVCISLALSPNMLPFFFNSRLKLTQKVTNEKSVEHKWPCAGHSQRESLSHPHGTLWKTWARDAKSQGSMRTTTKLYLLSTLKGFGNLHKTSTRSYSQYFSMDNGFPSKSYSSLRSCRQSILVWGTSIFFRKWYPW